MGLAQEAAQCSAHVSHARHHARLSVARRLLHHALQRISCTIEMASSTGAHTMVVQQAGSESGSNVAAFITLPQDDEAVCGTHSLRV